MSKTTELTDSTRHPHLKERFQRPEGFRETYLEGRDGYGLRIGSLKSKFNARAHVLMAIGLSEFIEKYYELAKDITDRGMDFTIYDPTGQGKSDPLLPALKRSPPPQHLDDYNRSVENLVRIRHTLDWEKNSGVPVILLGHSTGGLTATLTAQRHPGLFDGLMLTAPLSGGFAHGIMRGNEPLFAKIPVPECIREKGIYIQDTMPVYPGKVTDPAVPDETQLSRLSYDPVRNKVALKWLALHRDLHKGPATIGWFHEHCKAIAESRKHNGFQDMNLPALLAIGGKDELVNNLGLYKQGLAMPDCNMIDFPFASHELFMETNPVRDKLLDALEDLADRALSPG